jgi:hypothetical protein
MVPEVFADGVGRIHFHENMVRIELVSIVPPEADPAPGTPPKTEVRQRIVMTPAGLLRMIGALQELMRKLEAAGLVRRNEPGAAEAAARAAKKP